MQNLKLLKIEKNSQWQIYITSAKNLVTVNIDFRLQ